MQPPGSPAGYPGPYPNTPTGPYPNAPYPNAPYPSAPGGPYPGAPGGQPPYPPLVTRPPVKKSHAGRNVAIILGVLAALLCCGGPAAFGLHYTLLTDGPYHQPPNVCFTMNSATAERLKAGVAGSPEMAEATDKEPYVGCHWYKQGVFSFMVHVRIYHKSYLHDSDYQARDLYAFARRTVSPDVAVEDVMIGDQAFVELDDRNGAERFGATVRVGNAHIMIDYGGPFTNRTEPLSTMDRITEMNKFVPIARDLVADVVEDMH